MVESGKIVTHNLAGKRKLLLIKVTVVEHNSFLLGKSGTEGRKTLESGEDGGGVIVNPQELEFRFLRHFFRNIYPQ